MHRFRPVRAARADRRATALAAAAALTCPVRTAAGPADWRWNLNSWPGEQCLNAKLTGDSSNLREDRQHGVGIGRRGIESLLDDRLSGREDVKVVELVVHPEVDWAAHGQQVQ